MEKTSLNLDKKWIIYEFLKIKHQKMKWNEKEIRNNQINSDNGTLVIFKRQTKTASFQIKAMARFHWTVVAGNTYSKAGKGNEDLTRIWTSSSPRTSTNFPENEEHQISTKIYKLYIKRTVSTSTSRICHWFNLTLSIATGSIKNRSAHQTSIHDYSLNTQPNGKPQASC